MVPAELLKPPVTLRQRLIVQGRVSVMGGGTQAGGPLEQGVVLIDEVVNDLTVPAKVLHSPLRGRRLKQSAVMVDMIEGNKSRLQRNDFLSADLLLISGP